jgi:hypothetical protein
MSGDTPNGYAEADLEMKATSLAHCERKGQASETLAAQCRIDGLPEIALDKALCEAP